MRVAVGSGNPVKREAVARALPGATVEPVAVDSGVGEQPWGDDETIQGATNRARLALASGEFDCAVGIEGGVRERVVDQRETTERASGGTASNRERVVDQRETTERASGGTASQRADVFLVMWAVATDGDREELGAGPRLRLPDEVADRLRDGEELGPVMDDLLDTSGVAEDRGAAGVLTDGMTDRTEALRTAVAGALAPFVTDHY